MRLDNNSSNLKAPQRVMKTKTTEKKHTLYISERSLLVAEGPKISQKCIFILFLHVPLRPPY